jgi:hypothetical protein
MELATTSIIDRPINEVYELVRDNLDKIVPFLPNVEKIEVKKHAPLNENRTEVINHWYGKVDMPSLLKKFLVPEIFSWKDVAHWNNQEKFVEYKLQSFLANDLFDAEGKNSFIDMGDGTTKLEIKCSVKIYPDKVPGVPRLLANKVKPMIESMLEKLLGPNMTSLGNGLNEYYSQQK